jgi:hypothetical protein
MATHKTTRNKYQSNHRRRLEIVFALKEDLAARGASPDGVHCGLKRFSGTPSFFDDNAMKVCDPRRRAVRVLVVWLFATVVAAGRGDGPPTAEAFLSGPLRLSAEELRDLGRGQTVAKNLESRNSHEIAAVGVVRLEVLPALFLERFRDIARFKSDEAVLQIGRFSSPPPSGGCAVARVGSGRLARVWSVPRRRLQRAPLVGRDRTISARDRLVLVSARPAGNATGSAPPR